jgi:hypothetical protein
VHVVEPARPGSGVYDVTQPDYLVLNNPCGQLSLYPFASEDHQPTYGLGLYEWARAEGYGWVGETCVRDRSARPVEPHDFLPRRLMGEYLGWFYGALVAAAPTGVEIIHHRAAAVDLIARTDGTELVCLDNGEWLLVEHVIVTSGHTANEDHAEVVPHQRQLSPYPVTRYADKLPDGLRVGVSGMGLVAIDVVTALTVGRGGEYVEEGGRLTYRPSGREPKLVMFSRSGLPFCAKSVSGVDRTDVYKPIICTPDVLEAMTAGPAGSRRQVDVRSELLPVMFAEMCGRYYAQRAFQAGGNSVADGAAVRERLEQAWRGGGFEEELGRLAAELGPFDPKELFFGPELNHGSSEEYERAVYRMLEDDFREASVPGGASPVKSASEVFRIFRDPMRSVVEQGGLSLDSYLDFNADICSRIKRLVAGPPASRSLQFLALMDAGIIRAPFGPAPALGPGQGHGSDLGGLGDAVSGGGHGSAPVRLSSTLLGESTSGEVDLVIRGHLEEPRIDGSASVLLTRLYDEGRISQFRYGSVTVGSVDLTAGSHPIDLQGRVQERIWMFGVLTEGVRHFTHYIPSPKSRIRAFEDIGTCVAEILS